ncbi:MAG: YceI family protein [Mycobacteriales bacterium]
MQHPQAPESSRPRRRLSPTWILGGIAAVVILVFGGALFYTQVLNDDQPEKFTLSEVEPSSSPAGSAPAAVSDAASSSASSPAAAAGLNGGWTVGADSLVGYRVKEILVGLESQAVGRTSDVTGELTVTGDSVTAAKFTADLTTVKSDKSQRDGQFRGRIMDTGTHPTATFVSTEPIPVPAGAVSGQKFTSTVTGDLTLRGVTKSVTFDLNGQKKGPGFELVAQIPIVFADFDIPNPSGGPAQVGDDGILEVQLNLAPKD